MSIKQHATTYHCDGCGYETAQPMNWRSLTIIVASGAGYTGSVSDFSSSEDYCERCVQKMRLAILVGGNEDE